MTEPPRRLSPTPQERLHNVVSYAARGSDQGLTALARTVPQQGLPTPVAGLFEIVIHGDDPDVLRPPVALAYWVGAATPSNGLDYDFWYTDNV